MLPEPRATDVEQVLRLPTLGTVVTRRGVEIVRPGDSIVVKPGGDVEVVRSQE